MTRRPTSIHVLLALLLAVALAACGPGARPDDRLTTDQVLRERAELLAAARSAIVDDRLEAAIATLDRLLERNAQDAPALALRGVAHARLGAPFPAVADLAAAVAIAPSADGYLNLGLALQQFGFYDRAETALRAALEHAPDDAAIHHTLAASLAARGRYEEAEHHVAVVLGRRPRDPEVHTLHATILHGLLRDRDAERAFHEALRIAPDYHPALFNLARHYEARGRDDDAARLYRCYLEARPDAPDRTKIANRAADTPAGPCPGDAPDA